MLETAGLSVVAGVTLFIVTNIDEIVLLIGFFADRRMRARDVVAGQYAGLAVLVLLSLIAARASLLLPTSYVGLLGLVPVALGIRAFYRGDDDDDDNAPTASTVSSAWIRSLAVAAVTIANGGDNIGVYTPVFAVRTDSELSIIVLVFAVMTAVWCLMAHWLVNHRTAGAAIKKVARALTPYALVGIGLWVMYEAGTISLFG